MHLGAHAVDLGRLYATQRILGVIGVLWAFIAGLFLTLGGGQRMTYPSWQPLLEVTSSVTTVPLEQCFRIVGGVMVFGGMLGVIGLVFTKRWVSLTSAAVCALWCAVVAGFLGMSNVNVTGGGNFLSVAITFIGLVYLVRFFLLVLPPRPGRSVQLYERG